ncbi:uncharacterized protein [Amphiura filiformis]|uniref:uncharacterized protein n=1 Tax=Amphiura filiformis TaxID=82378 RepID=UPI003B21DA61
MDCTIRFVGALLLCSAFIGHVANCQSLFEHVFAIPQVLKASNKPRVLITTNSLDPVSVNVSVGTGFEYTTTVTRYRHASIALTTSIRLTTSGKSNATIKVTSSDIVSVHCIDNEMWGGDGFLVLPTAELGKQYYVVTYHSTYEPYDPPYPAFFCVSALNTGSVIDIKTNAGEIFQITLEAYESYRFNGNAYEDLTGTFIESTEPVSVISGVYTKVPAGISGTDGLLEMIPPVESWGYHFILAPFLDRTSGYVYRVISHNRSTMNISNRGSVDIEAESWFEDDISGDSVITIMSDQPVLVVQIMKSKGAEGNLYDPAMIIIPPLNSYVNNVTFPVIEMVKAYTYNMHVTINCIYANELMFDENNSMRDWERLDDHEICIIRGHVTTGVHTVSHQDPDAKFTVAVYGLRQAGSAYAYPAGFNAASYSEDEITTKANLATDELLDVSPTSKAVDREQGSGSGSGLGMSTGQTKTTPSLSYSQTPPMTPNHSHHSLNSAILVLSVCIAIFFVVIIVITYVLVAVLRRQTRGAWRENHTTLEMRAQGAQNQQDVSATSQQNIADVSVYTNLDKTSERQVNITDSVYTDLKVPDNSETYECIHK